MSKRGAEEYITKEHGSTLNSSSGETKVKMATAAQMAKRKMAVPKSRAGRTGQSPMPGAGISNPFSGSSTFGAQQDNSQPTFPAAGGFTFGASQSFPTGDTQNNSFNFSVPGQSSSFTFGQSVDNNPFATLNGGVNEPQQQNQDSADTMMESPQKKPAFGSSLFGSSDGKDKSQSTGLSFGQQSSQPSFSFGQSQQQVQPNSFGSGSSTPLFGQSVSKPPEQPPTSTLFGQTTQAQSDTPATSNIFGQKSTPSQQGQPSGFSFGQPATSAPSSTPVFGFGQPSTQPASSGTLFGGLTQTSQPAFGSSLPASQPAVSAPLFGSAPPTTNGNVFGGFGNPTPAETTTTSESPKPGLFGQSSTDAAQEEPKPASSTPSAGKGNPFASLFGPKPAEPAISSATETAKPVFSFAPPVQSTSSFTVSKPDQDFNTKPPEDTPKKPLFSFGTPSAASSANLFSPAKSASEPLSSTNPFANLSAKTPEPSKQNTNDGSEVTKETPSKPASLFQPLPAFGSTSSAKPLSSNTPASNLFGSNNKSQVTAPSTAQKRSANSQEPTESTPQPTTTPASTARPTAKPQAGDEAPSRSVNTNPPTRIPPYLNGDDYKAYDSNYRLHSLNREFQKRIAAMDPSRDDFENIVRNYVAARESIGESIGLYTRNVAGMKRKADDDHEDRPGSDSVSSKRTKSDEVVSPHTSFETSHSNSSIFKPVPSSSSINKPSPSFGASPAKPPAPTTSNASSLFSSMIPKGGSSQFEANSTNPFANLNKTPMSTSTQSAFSFGATSSVAAPTESTTPTKSPPKKAAFEMPKFATSGGVNFMDAFKKQSEVNAKEAARQAKEKRKLEDFDSDEDNEEEWEKKYEEEEKAKRAEISSIAQKGFTPIFGNTTSSPDFDFNSSAGTLHKITPGPAFGDQIFGKSSDKPIDISDNDADEDDEEGTGSGESADVGDDEEETETNEDDLPEDEVDGDDEEEDDDLETAMARARNKGKSLFERVTPNPSLQPDSNTKKANGSSAPKETIEKSTFFSNSIAKGTPEAPSFSPLTPAGSKEPYVPSKTFNFVPTPPTTSSTPTPGASIFAGGLIKDGPVTGEGLFGSRPSTPSNGDKPKSNMFGGLGTPVAANTDNTWKKGSEIKFGASEGDAPIVNITEATPRKDESKPFANLFGASTMSNNTSAGSNLGFNFGSSPAPGFLSAASHLTGTSGTNSGMSSRATSPGTTDNESVATNEEDFSNDTQVSLMETRPGEENETILNEVRARALRWYNEEQIEGTKLEKGWNTMGLGIARLLKNRETKKVRLVMRAEPGANIILNTNLQSQVRYESKPSGNNGTIIFSVFTNEGAQKWLLKVKTIKAAEDMAKMMEESKG